MPPKDPPPLTERERGFLAEAVEGFWRITEHSFRASTPRYIHLGPMGKRKWHALFVSQTTTLFEKFVNEIHARTLDSSQGDP